MGKYFFCLPVGGYCMGMAYGWPSSPWVLRLIISSVNLDMFGNTCYVVKINSRYVLQYCARSNN
jgi:hypothetical protein